MGNIKDLQQKVVTFRDTRDWKQFHNPKDLSISLVLEATEVLEHFQWKSPDEVERHVNDHKADIAEELADTLYWILLLANDLDINIEDAFDRKMQKNANKYTVEKAKGNHKKYTEL